MASRQIVISNLYPTDHLCPAAKRMARKSVNRLSEKPVAKQMTSLRKLLRVERQCRLRMGDVLIQLVDRHGIRVIDIARAVKERANFLSEMYYVSKLFPARHRHPGVPFTHLWMAMRTVKRFRTLSLDPLETLAEIAANGFTQHRQVTAHFAAKARGKEAAETLAHAERDAGGAWFNRCYHARFESLLDVFPDGSIKMIWGDPPYANYRRRLDGSYCGGSRTTTACDAGTTDESIASTVALLRDWGVKLKAGGALVLWQASGPLRTEIDAAIHEAGWAIEAVVVWDKGHPQPGNFTAPYSRQSEWAWVLKRDGDALVNHNDSPRGDVLRFAPVHQATDDVEHSHAFEKPLDLCRFMLEKHSHPGDLVFDCFGCTGSMCLAAIETGRRWVYSESHPGNFEIGNTKIGRATAAPKRVAG